MTAIESRRIEKITAIAKDKGLPVVVLHKQTNANPILLADANLSGIDGAAIITEVLSTLIAE